MKTLAQIKRFYKKFDLTFKWSNTGNVFRLTNKHSLVLDVWLNLSDANEAIRTKDKHDEYVSYVNCKNYPTYPPGYTVTHSTRVIE